MRALARLLVALPVGLLVILFAVSNRGMVEVTLDPLPGAVSLPLALIVLGMGLVGFVAGGLVVWLGQGRHRRLAREARRHVEALKAELGMVKAAHVHPPAAAAKAKGTGLALR